MLSGVRTACDRQLVCFLVIVCCLQLGTFPQSVFVEVFRKEQWEQLWLQSHLCQ